jgi:Histidine kinase-, DNA gyrase B-, and HSP90-like ATPase
MLHEFLATNRALLIERCRVTAAARPAPKADPHECDHGNEVFIDQLVSALTISHKAQNSPVNSKNAVREGPPNREVHESATLHGRDMLHHGYTIEQVVRNYGDVCQAVTKLAFETGAPIGADEFHAFNRCLDDAIASAVTEYAKYIVPNSEFVSDALNSRLGPLANELRSYLYSATLTVAAIRAGNVGVSGASGALLDRSLFGMRSLLDRALAEVRVTTRLPPRRQAIQLVQFFDKLKLSASFDALASGVEFTITPVADDLAVYAEPDMLAAAIGNLLSNAFRFTKAHTEVQLCATVLNDRVLINVEDRCGGLPTGAAEVLFLPSVPSDGDRSGLGLGLDISRCSIEANGGELSVRDVPGTGCIFTINLPRLTDTQARKH